MLAVSWCPAAAAAVSGSLSSTVPRQHSTFLGSSLVLRRGNQVTHSRATGIRAAAENGEAKKGPQSGWALRLFGWLPGAKKGENKTPVEGGKKAKMEKETPPSRTVLVVGATGRTGREAVKYLLKKGDRVVALVSSEERGDEVFKSELGYEVGKTGPARWLEYAEGDITKPATLAASLKNCDAVLYAAGARFSSAGYTEGSNPKDVDGVGVANLVREAVKAFEGRKGQREEESIFDFSTLKEAGGGEENGAPAAAAPRVDGWVRLDDVIMGGISDSEFRPGPGCAVFEGTVRVEGGGFCGTRAEVPSPKKLAGFDGITVRVRGDGQRYKMNLKSVMERPEFTYQTSFDTVRGEWVTVDIPFDRFRPVLRAKVVEDAPPLNRDDIKSVGLVLSRFEYDGYPNLCFNPGAFKLEVASIKAYKAPRPQFVLLSSAAVERSAKARKPEERARQIPIVKLNPGGILWWKLAGEDCLRASGLSYAVVRACGLTTADQEVPFNLEVAQGDVLVGPISRAEAAQCCVEALDSPDATNATFEVRRDELSKGFPMEDWTGLFRRLRPDRKAAIVNFSPIPDVPWVDGQDSKKGENGSAKSEKAKEPEGAAAS